MSVAALLLTAGTAFALPSGNKLAAGQATVSTPAAGRMQITQTSDRAVMDWSSFSILKGEAVNISQPSSRSALLNRVVDNSASEIYGSLTANDQVFLINPNGILFGQGASVNVGGLVASSLDISDDNFMNAALTFYNDGAAGSVVNRGGIHAGFAALLGPRVDNSGSIVTSKGSTALGAAEAVTLDFDADGMIALTLEQGAYNARVQNSGIIEADGGTVLLTAKSADDILKSMVNTSGVIRARSVENRSGTILLLGDMDNGTLAAGGQTGAWLIDPYDFTVSSGSAAQTSSGIGADTLSGNLGTTDVTLSTDPGDINVDAAVSWNAATTLTLDAYNDININADISGPNGTLKLYYGQGTSGGSGYSLNNGAKVTLSEGNHFYTRQGSSGSEISWTVITNPGSEGSTTGADLQGMQNNLSGHYVLGADIDAGGTSSWNGGAGFNPVGDDTTDFTGGFDGLGHTITGLTINRPGTGYIGLFGISSGTISNVGLVDCSVTGGYWSVGGLAGENHGTITSCYWDVDTSGQTTGIGSGTATGATGLRTRQWLTDGPVVTNAWDTTGTWVAGYPYPVLQSLPYVLVTATGTQVYGSTTPSGSVTGITDQNGNNAAALVDTGGLNWLSAADSTSSAGSVYVLGGTGATVGAGYQLTYTGTLTVTPAPPTIRPANNINIRDQLVPLIGWRDPHGNANNLIRGPQSARSYYPHREPFAVFTGSGDTADLLVVIDGGVRQ